MAERRKEQERLYTILVWCVQGSCTLALQAPSVRSGRSLHSYVVLRPSIKNVNSLGGTRRSERSIGGLSGIVKQEKMERVEFVKG